MGLVETTCATIVVLWALVGGMVMIKGMSGREMIGWLVTLALLFI